MALYTIGNQFNETTSYGKVNLDKLEIYKTANNIQEFLTTQYNLSQTLLQGYSEQTINITLPRIIIRGDTGPYPMILPTYQKLSPLGL